MARYTLTEEVKNDVKGLSLNQVFFFVMSTKKKNATVLAAYVSKSMAERDAETRRSCVRVGYIFDGEAVVS